MLLKQNISTSKQSLQGACDCANMIFEYRFGFNGQEKDNEVGQGVYTAENWEYDSRIGRRWNLDPKPNPSFSSYATFSCNPILFSDPKGDTSEISQRQWGADNDIQKSSAFERKIDNDPGINLVNTDERTGATNKTYSPEAVCLGKRPEKTTTSESSSSVDNTAWYDKASAAMQGHSETEDTKFDNNFGKPAGAVIAGLNPIYTAVSLGYMAKTGKLMDESGDKAKAADYILTGGSVLFWGASEVSSFLKISNSTSVGLEVIGKTSEMNGAVIDYLIVPTKTVVDYIHNTKKE
jgi:RHS repeat-associated protein